MKRIPTNNLLTDLPDAEKIRYLYQQLFKKPIGGFTEIAKFQKIWNEYEDGQELSLRRTI